MDGPVFDLFKDDAAEFVASPPAAEFAPGQSFGPEKAARALSAAPTLAQFLRQLDVAIVHCNDGRSNAIWSLPAKIAGAKLIWHNRGNPNSRGLRLAAPFLPDRVISVSHFASPRAGILSASRKNTVVYSPFELTTRVDRKAARDRLAKEVGAQTSTKFVGYFGLLIDRKRPLLFVETIAAMRRMAPEMSIVGLFFGEVNQDLAEKAEKLAALLGVEGCIRFMGFRTPGAEWIAACDLLLVTAVDEPFGRTLIEAMIVGTPVVATASGGNIEAIDHGKTGLLAEPENAADLAAEAVRLLRDRSLADQIVAAAQAGARAKFGESRHVQAVMKIYDDVLGLAKSGRSHEAPAAGSEGEAVR